MITVGVDLAAEPKGTAVAALEWSADGAAVRHLVLGADDTQIVEAASTADKVGIDCPLGWPVPFIEFVIAHRDGHVPVPPDLDGRDWRRTLALRTTDLAVRHETGLTPFSVAADRIGHTTMRCAGLLARLARDGFAVDRRGTGLIVEVYTAAALQRWNLPHRRYKGAPNTSRLDEPDDALLASAPWLSLETFDTVCRRSDHATDAAVAAITARAAALNRTTTPPAEQAELASIEGWIAIPTSPLSDLGPKQSDDVAAPPRSADRHG